MTSNLIDISIPLEDKEMLPSHHRPRIKYFDHKSDASWKGFQSYYPGATRENMADGEAWAIEEVSAITHAGTHMDAPWHYHSTMNHALTPGGEPASTIDQVPLDWCIKPGVKLDFRHMDDGYVVGPDDVAAELSRIEYKLCPLDIVLINTRAGTMHEESLDYWNAGCGMGRDATLYLLERGVRVVGTDAWGWDAPFSYTAKKFKTTGDPALLWEGHKAGRDIGYYQMEKLVNLEKLPSQGFEVICFPIKIKGASAAWTRAVARFSTP